MNIPKLSFFCLLAAGAFSLASVAHAQLIDISVTTTATTAATATTPTATKTTATSGAGINIDVGADAPVEAILEVDRSDVSVEGTTTMSASAVAPSTVTTDTDLETYARTLVENDENISRVRSDDESVSIWYKDKARFLGFIPMDVSAQAIVNSDGSVAVVYPWYSFLTAQEDRGIESDLDLTAGSIARTEGRATLSASTKARIMDAAASVMRAHYQADVGADVSATATTAIE